ncbi:MAG: aryl-sulfate sulfotransferase [Clostridiales bacterium]|jgi:hypothetical protein|nr:aryl-sulfate sulfotransferase [Clostridiales bacterium]
MNKLSDAPRPPINQGIDKDNQMVLRHTTIYNSLLAHITEDLGDAYYAINPYGTAPLSGYIGVWAKDTSPIRVQISDDIGSIPVDYSYTPTAGANLIPLLGISADAANKVTVTAPGLGTSVAMVITNPLPPSDETIPTPPADNVFTGFPTIEVTIPSANPPKTVIDLYFLSFADRYNIGLDENGTVRWYTTLEIPAGNPERFSNGHFYATSNKFNFLKILYEFDMVGRVYNVYIFDNRVHHSILELPDGNILIPSEYTGTTLEDGLSIVDINTGLETAYYDMRSVLDTKRIPKPRIEDELDWLHINQSYLDIKNNLFVCSARHQCVFAVDATTSELSFILANQQGWGVEFEKFFLTPVDSSGTPLYDLSNPVDIDKADKEFWPWGQHDVYEVPNETKGIADFLLFDNGNYRSREDAKALLPNDNASRLIHYRVDLNKMTVMIVYEYGTTEVGKRGYSSYVCNVQILDNNNYFINFGGILIDENGRLTSVGPGITDIVDPLDGKMVLGKVLAQEIDPISNKALIEFTCTSGKYKTLDTDGPAYRTAFFSFRSHKYTMLP